MPCVVYIFVFLCYFDTTYRIFALLLCFISFFIPYFPSFPFCFFPSTPPLCDVFQHPFCQSLNHNVVPGTNKKDLVPDRNCGIVMMADEFLGGVGAD